MKMRGKLSDNLVVVGVVTAAVVIVAVKNITCLAEYEKGRR